MRTPWGASCSNVGIRLSPKQGTRRKPVKTCSLARPDELQYGAATEAEMHRIDCVIDDVMADNETLNGVHSSHPPLFS